ncbi:MAG: 50S ribosomal protein L24 [Candidatus Pacearchaeota archaeon]
MKKKFSKFWKSSKKPRKQRKYIINAPLHIKRKMMSSNLSKELRKRFGIRSFPLRKGDTVRVFRTKFKGKEGKVLKVNYKKNGVEISGIQIKKQDGSRVNVLIHPSNLQIIELNLEDKKRAEALKRKETKT